MEWLERANPNLQTAAFGVISLVVAIWAALFALIPHRAARRRERILDTRNWSRMIAALNPDWATRYYSAIAASRGWFDRVYGARLWGWRAFDRALLFAFVYASLSLMIGWVVFDAGHLGGVPFLPEGLARWQRAAMVFAWLVGSGALFLILRFQEALKSWHQRWFEVRPAIMNRVTRRSGLSSGSLAKIMHSLLLVVAAAGAVAVAVAGGVVGIGAVAFTIAVAGAVAFAGTIALASAAAVAVAVAVALAFASASRFPYFNFDFHSLSEAEILAITVIPLFLVVLPLLNAIADVLSVAATRYFLRRIDATKLGAVGVLAGLALDIGIAVGCLTLLLWLITQTLDLWAYIAPVTLPFDWRAYRDSICGGNWQDGTMLWLMLSTTLAPTAFHLALGVGAIASHRARVDADILAILVPAQQRLQTTCAGVEETGDGSLARRVLDADAVHRLEDLLARREGAAWLWSVALFVLFMAGLIGAVLALAWGFALPVLCPQLDATAVLA